MPIALEFPQWAQILFIILGGACVGSFLNVVIIRLPRNRSIVAPRSRTFPWRSPIPWHRNIPIWSYVVSLGRCLQSGLHYSPRYLIVEVLTPLLFLAIYMVHGWTMETLVYAIFTSCLIAGSFIDLDLRILPDSLTLGAWAVALLMALFQAQGYPLNIWQAVFGSIVGYASFWILSRGYFWLTGDEGLGGGDVKLMGFIGAVLGIEGVLITVLVGSLTGAVVGLILMGIFRKGRRFPIPFGPFLAAGALVSVLELDLFSYWLVI